MGKKSIKYIFLISICLLSFSGLSLAQFRQEAFTQTYNDVGDTTSSKDSTEKMFSFKELFGGLSHKQEMRIGVMTAGSMFLPGSGQIYNKDYWKLPVVYGGIGAFAGTGVYYRNKYNKSKKAYDKAFALDPNTPLRIDNKAKTTGNLLLAGAGLIYWGSLLDGAMNYHPDRQPHPGRATIYSILLPGLGQAYNKEYWKIPIYYGGLITSIHFLTTNNKNYWRFKNIHNEATNPDITYEGPIDAETAKWYRDVYRRYRDYSVVATALIYLLQVMDANVFAYMHDFEVSDDISMKIEPTIILPDYNAYALSPNTNSSVGFKIGFNF